MTRAKFVGLLGVLALVLPSAVPARADQETRASKAYVVVVGIDNYGDKQIKPRKHAEADAKALYELLTDKKYLGVSPENARLLLGSGTGKDKATHANTLDAVKWLVSKAGRDDLAVFAWFGSGAPNGEQTCYFTTDSTFKGRARDSLAAAEIEHEMEKLKSQRFVAFLDVNFKGFDAGGERAPEANIARFYQEFFGKAKAKEDEEDRRREGRILFLANDGMHPSLDLDKHGIFAQAILNGLKGGADKEGYGPDGNVTVEELEEYLAKELPALARQNGKTPEEKRQLPIILGSRASHFVLVHNPEVMPKVQARLDKLAQLARDKKLSPELAREGENLLSRMPKLKAYQKLRKEYEKLADGEATVENLRTAREGILESIKLRRSAANAYAQRVMEAARTLKRDYYKDISPGEMISSGIKALFRRLQEPIPADLQERLSKAKTLKDSELYVLLAEAREKLGKREDLDDHKDIDLTLQLMCRTLDPYTTYIDPATVERWRQDTTGQFSGIGVQIRKDFATDMLQVVTPIKGSPAFRAGMQAGDIITTITREVDNDGKRLDPPEVIPTKGLPLSDAVKKILGKPGTRVKLTVEREGSAKPLEFEITRGRVSVESVLGAKRKDDATWDYYIDPANQIAYVRILSFQRNTYDDLERVMADLTRQGIKGLVLDLRFNPGGLLDSAVKVCDLFIDDGHIVTIRPRVGEEDVYKGRHDGSLLDFPMVCLVNGGSASGSEIVGACLQDHNRAIIMGERSYGKGSVQNIRNFDGGELKMTIATFHRMNGGNLNKLSTPGRDEDQWGVRPDKKYELKLSPKESADLDDHLRWLEIIQPRGKQAKQPNPDFKDRQLEMAVEYLRGQIKMAKKGALKKEG